jgi:hypothetical protein
MLENRALHGETTTKAYHVMKKIVKIFLIGLGTLIGGVVLSVIVYDFMVFQPYCSQIKTFIQNSHPLYKRPPKALHNIAILAEGKNGIRSHVVQSLLIQFGRNKQRMLNWHCDSLLWMLLMDLHFTEAENFALWCYFTPYEHGVGLHESANFYYGRNLDQLSLEEMTTVVARGRYPLVYQKYPEKLEKRVNDLLAKYLSMYGNEE